MAVIQLLREATVSDLKSCVPDNLERYRAGDFEYLLTNTANLIETELEFDESQLKNIVVNEGDRNEVQCCLTVYKMLSTLPLYLARDARLWTYFTHTLLLSYSRARWPIPVDDKEAVAHIHTHFFASTARGIERDNAVSRLWWMAALCAKVEGIPLEDTLTAFLFRSDVRANIVERPTTSQNNTVLATIIRKLDASLKGDQELYVREKFRSVMEKLNVQGGVKLFEALEPSEVEKIFNKCADM